MKPFAMPMLPLFLLSMFLLPGCASTSGEPDATTGDGLGADIPVQCVNPAGDEDGDGIPDGEEGCLTGRDSDGDKIPDWQDCDSDDDGISDDVEKGSKDGSGRCTTTKAPKNAWPCDHDGDGLPDYVDTDSDGDGLLDKDEDKNGDGLLGCCVDTCDKPGATQAKECIFTDDGCGSGQRCVSGKCTPSIGFKCSNGETSPVRKDNERGTFICRDATEDQPQGRKAVQLRKSVPGDWHVAVETSSKYGELKIANAGPKEAAAVVDEDSTAAEVAGFVISRDTDKDSVQDELSTMLQAIGAKPPGGSATLSQRASGSQTKSHDRFDTVQGTVLDLTLSIASNVSTVRNELIGVLMGKPMADLGNLPAPYGSSHTEIVIRLVTLKRFEFKKDIQGNLVKDAKGFPVDSGDKSKWRLMIMGAVAGRANYQDPGRTTGLLVDDLSGGTALATVADAVVSECDVDTITGLPVADIIWVVDESGSMADKRKDVVANANNFFSRALSSGLDFRMGITGVCDPSDTSYCKGKVGKFCSQIATSPGADSGVDRFLLPTEQAIFSSCIENPPGHEMGSEYGLVNTKQAVVGHLPRAVGDPSRIRTGAKLVVIIATDEVPQSLTDGIGLSPINKCQMDGATTAKVQTALQPYLDLLTGVTDPEAAATVHLIGGLCTSTGCAWAPDVCHGYIELAQQLGGQMGDVCQKDLGATLQIIIDSIIADASPVKLDYVPISASLAVALDGAGIQRSRTNGFDYRSSQNTLVFINVKYKKGTEVVVSYKRWQRQEIPG